MTEYDVPDMEEFNAWYEIHAHDPEHACEPSNQLGIFQLSNESIFQVSAACSSGLNTFPAPQTYPNTQPTMEPADVTQSETVEVTNTKVVKAVRKRVYHLFEVADLLNNVSGICGEWVLANPNWPVFRLKYHSPDDETYQYNSDSLRVQISFPAANFFIGTQQKPYIYLLGCEDGDFFQLVSLIEQFTNMAISDWTKVNTGWNTCLVSFNDALKFMDDANRQAIADLNAGHSEYGNPAFNRCLRIKSTTETLNKYLRFMEADHDTLPLVLEFSQGWVRNKFEPNQASGLVVNLQPPVQKVEIKRELPAVGPIYMTSIMSSGTSRNLPSPPTIATEDEVQEAMQECAPADMMEPAPVAQKRKRRT